MDQIRTYESWLNKRVLIIYGGGGDIGTCDAMIFFSLHDMLLDFFCPHPPRFTSTVYFITCNESTCRDQMDFHTEIGSFSEWLNYCNINDPKLCFCSIMQLVLDHYLTRHVNQLHVPLTVITCTSVKQL